MFADQVIQNSEEVTVDNIQLRTNCLIYITPMMIVQFLNSLDAVSAVSQSHRIKY